VRESVREKPDCACLLVEATRSWGKIKELSKFLEN
jgi:hypothetical protein